MRLFIRAPSASLEQRRGYGESMDSFRRLQHPGMKAIYSWKPSSSSNFSIRAFRACPLTETRQTAPCRAIRGKSSGSRQQYLSQEYPPPLLTPLSVISRPSRTRSSSTASRAPCPRRCLTSYKHNIKQYKQRQTIQP